MEYPSSVEVNFFHPFGARTAELEDGELGVNVMLHAPNPASKATDAAATYTLIKDFFIFPPKFIYNLIPFVRIHKFPDYFLNLTEEANPDYSRFLAAPRGGGEKEWRRREGKEERRGGRILITAGLGACNYCTPSGQPVHNFRILREHPYMLRPILYFSAMRIDDRKPWIFFKSSAAPSPATVEWKRYTSATPS